MQIWHYRECSRLDLPNEGHQILTILALSLRGTRPEAVAEREVVSKSHAGLTAWSAEPDVGVAEPARSNSGLSAVLT